MGDADPVQTVTSAGLRAQALLKSARVWADRNRYGEALVLTEKSLEADPLFARAHCARAFYLAKLGRGEEALTLLNDLLARNPTDADALSTLGACHLEAGRLDDAAPVLAEAVRLGPDNSLAHYNYACFCARTNREENCRAALTRALALEPRDKSRAAVDPDLALYRETAWFLELVALRR